MIVGQKNKGFFANAKAAAWCHARLRFQDTHRTLHRVDADSTTGSTSKRATLVQSPDPLW